MFETLTSEYGEVAKRISLRPNEESPLNIIAVGGKARLVFRASDVWTVLL